MRIIPLDVRYYGRDLSEKFMEVCVQEWTHDPRKSMLNSRLALELIRHMIISSKNNALMNAVLNLADAADKSGETNAYHNALHTAQVAMMTAYFCRQDCTISDSDYLIALASAFAHDLKHPGKSNPENDSVYNERRSAIYAGQIMRNERVDEETIRDMTAIVVSTSPNGPHSFVKDGAIAEPLLTEQSRIVAKGRLLKIAQIVCDADIFSSAGVSLENCEDAAAKLTKESLDSGVDVNLNTPQCRLYFLEHIVGKGGFASSIARDLANENFNKIYHSTRALVA